jgi:hypothetical protein
MFVPAGYQAANDTTREVTLAAGVAPEAVIEFAIHALGAPVPAQDGQPSPTPLPTPTVLLPTWTPVLPTWTPPPPAVLPQTGSALPVAVLMALALAGLLALGLGLVALSRWVAARP